jgi:hypothetical protein
MADDRWRPLRVRHAGKESQHDALVEGVPPWLRRSLFDWLDEFLKEESDFGTMVPSAPAVRAVEVNLRIDGLDWDQDARSAYDSLLRKCEDDSELFLSVIDFFLWVVRERAGKGDHVEQLDRFLYAGGSAWMVAPDRSALVRRVMPESAEAARALAERDSRAGAHIAEAWRYAYGRNPHPGTAYREAVKAVEAAACPVTIPKAGTPTLGKAIAALRDAPEGKFECVFPGTESGMKPLDAVRTLMDLVWTNQHDRHAAMDTEAPLHVSQAEAEAALHAAVTLVQWFEHGAVRAAGDA